MLDGEGLDEKFCRILVSTIAKPLPDANTWPPPNRKNNAFRNSFGEPSHHQRTPLLCKSFLQSDHEKGISFEFFGYSFQ